MAQGDPSAMRDLVDVERLREALRTGRGAGVKVAVLDSGVDGGHPAFADRLRAQFDVVAGRNGPVCVQARPTDGIGHGTACAGIVLQLAPEADIYSVKVIGNDSRGTADQLVAGLTFALDQGYDVINMSLGTTDARIMPRLGALADRAFYEGRIIVAAANNQGRTAYPAQFSSVLSVNMEAFEEATALRYDRGNAIELSARGIYVEAPAPGGGTQLFTGTSFACPHVSGMVARVLSVHPGLAAHEARLVLSLLSPGGA